MVYRFHNGVSWLQVFKNTIFAYVIEVIALVDILWVQFLTSMRWWNQQMHVNVWECIMLYYVRSVCPLILECEFLVYSASCDSLLGVVTVSVVTDDGDFNVLVAGC